MSKGLILIVDDVEDTRLLIGELLRFAGYETALAADGNEALTKARLEPPDLVITDFMMPGMNGVELAQRLCEQSPSGQIPVLLVTAIGNEGMSRLSAATPKPCARVVPKPFDPDALIRLIDGLLESPPAP